MTSSTKISSLDTARWGVVTATTSDVSVENLPSLLVFGRDNAVGLLIARCPTTDLRTAQAMEGEGFRLMDTLVYYSRDVAAGAPAPSGCDDFEALSPPPGDVFPSLTS